jgi:hypothetical protein
LVQYTPNLSDFNEVESAVYFNHTGRRHAEEQALHKRTLNTRIDEAAKAHLITNEMAAWAHEIRLDANDERHADEDVPLPDQADARKCLDFALALAQFLFVLPARVERGRKDATPTPPTDTK